MKLKNKKVRKIRNEVLYSNLIELKAEKDKLCVYETSISNGEVHLNPIKRNLKKCYK